MGRAKCKNGLYFLLGAIVGTIIGLYINTYGTYPCERNLPKIVHLKASEEKISFSMEKDSLFFSDSSLRRFGKELINTPELAAQIGICYLCDIYGKDVIKEEIPFNIVEFQHSWLLEGTLPPNSYGGVASIYITKKDGMVIDYIHEK